MSGKNEKREKKAAVMAKVAKSTTDTGTPEVQVALLTSRINELNQHFKAFPKDNFSRRGLLRLVGQRRRLLSYLKDRDFGRYSQLIQKLELRK